MKWPEYGGDSLLILRSNVEGDYEAQMSDDECYWVHWIEHVVRGTTGRPYAYPVVEGLLYEDIDSHIFCIFSSRSLA